jgi:Tfp pilus assembly protein PilN
MITLTRPEQIWSTMPGWGIVADLTPPELIASRRLAVVRRLIGAVLIVMVLIAAGGLYLATINKNKASSGLTDEQGLTTSLQREQNKLAGVVQLQGSISAVQGQIQSVMAPDVDFSTLLGQVRKKLPNSMTISQVDLTISPTASTAGGSSGTLDTSGDQHIGSITLSGNGSKLSDVAAYVDALSTVKGVIDPYPITNQVGAKGVQYNIQITVTNAAYSEKYTGATTGSK